VTNPRPGFGVKLSPEHNGWLEPWYEADEGEWHAQRTPGQREAYPNLHGGP